jgi:hypothetical protein
MVGQIYWWICQNKLIVVCLFIDNVKEVVEKTCENILWREVRRIPSIQLGIGG